MTNFQACRGSIANLTGAEWKCVNGLLRDGGRTFSGLLMLELYASSLKAGLHSPMYPRVMVVKTDDAHVPRDRKHQLWIQMTGN